VTVPSGDGVTGFGENNAVAPAGTPLALSVTGPLKLFRLVTAMVVTPAVTPVCPMVTVAGDALMPKFVEGAFTISGTLMFCVRLPVVASIPRLNVPVAVDAVVEIVSTDFPDALREGGLNVPVAPDGNPRTLKFTVPVKPVLKVTVVV